MDLQAELQRLADERGLLTAEAVLEAATPADSPLHRYFTWDDAAAAHAQRLEEARRLIRSVRVVITPGSQLVSSVAWVRAPTESKGYLAVVQVRTQAETARAVMLQEIERLEAMLERVRGLAAALDLEHMVTPVIYQIHQLRSEVRSP